MSSHATFRHKTSKLPLTTAQVIELMDSAESGNKYGQGLVAGFWEDWTRDRIDED